MAVVRKHTTQTNEMRAVPAYIRPCFSKQELDKLNALLARALVDRHVSHRLLVLRDARLRDEFDLAQSTWARITGLQASSLEELCQKILRLQEDVAEQLTA